MKTRMLLTVLGATWLVCASAQAANRAVPAETGRIIHGGSSHLAKAEADTIALMGPTGSGAAYLGDFESGWNGWTTFDATAPTLSHWSVSDYNQPVAGNLAAWCGDIDFASCNDTLDVAGGYGNNWHEALSFRATVSDPSVAAIVTFSATLQHDTEPGYDYVYLSTKTENSPDYIDVNRWDGPGTVVVDERFTYLPHELVGGNEVYFEWRVLTDFGWSDEDCSYYTAGACQLDDITVTTSQAGQPDQVSFTDFQDGTLGDWSVALPGGAGDFSALWVGLNDLDPCAVNSTTQVAFIDDGLVVPGTGGSVCQDWCYGPGGYVVNTTGGLLGADFQIENEVHSPVMDWPNAGDDGMEFAFDIYRHNSLGAPMSGILYEWSVRSADLDNSAGNGAQVLEDQPFVGRNFVYFGGPEYFRHSDVVTDLLNPGRDVVQVRFQVYEQNLVWCWNCTSGTPAPYFDNFSVKVFPHDGPGMVGREIDLAQDGFPAIDALIPGDLGALSVRFDMASNISPAAHLRNDPGDSIVVDVVPIRTGAVLVGAPELHYTIDTNPVFDPFRTTAASGTVSGWPAPGASPGKWAFDLPDSGLLFPGDVLHYYFRAGDDVSGDIRWATMPADITGFGDFSDPLAYNTSFVVHALPTIRPDGAGGYEAPAVLFWNDFADLGGQDEWYTSLRRHGMVAGVDYDIYLTNGPDSGVGNGLGGRTGGPALAYYDDILYTAGDLGSNTISNGDFVGDAGDDIGALTNWLGAGNKDLFLSGDNLALDLGSNAGSPGVDFLASVMGLDLSVGDIRTFIDNQTSPLVLAAVGNPVFQNLNQWIAYGGCADINAFDGVTVRAGATRLAEFGDLNGAPGAYAYSAATLNLYNATNRVVSLPYDLMSVYTDVQAKSGAPLGARDMLLQDVLSFFDRLPTGFPTPVLPSPAFALSNFPNPFNPRTEIHYTVKSAGHLSLKIYNVRGQLVRTLLNGPVQTAGHIIWDGSDDGGGPVASGVYFSEGRMGADVLVRKMMLVR